MTIDDQSIDGYYSPCSENVANGLLMKYFMARSFLFRETFKTKKLNFLKNTFTVSRNSDLISFCVKALIFSPKSAVRIDQLKGEVYYK